jgi:Putative transposase
MIRTNWRRGLINHLRDLHADGLLRSKLSKAGISKELDYQFDQWWKVGVRNVRSNHSYISYIARYLRRPPIANRNILSIENATMAYMGKNTKSGQQERIEISARELISRLIAQSSKSLCKCSALLRVSRPSGEGTRLPNLYGVAGTAKSKIGSNDDVARPPHQRV